MKLRPGSARAWLELARISNAPTVVSNALAGAAIAAAAANAPLDARATGVVALGATTIYAAGMIVNDVFDAEADRRERPGRPIPSGRITRTHAAAVGGAMLAAGAAVMFSGGARPGLVGLVLAGLVVLYNAAHHLAAASVLLMGLCRGLVYAAAISIAVPIADRPLTLVPAAVLALYTAAFSLLARGEADPDATTRPSLAWLAALLGLGVVATAARGGAQAWWGVLPALALSPAALRASSPDRRRAVMTFIAAFSLIDAAVCAALGRFDLALACAGCWILTALGHRRILGT